MHQITDAFQTKMYWDVGVLIAINTGGPMRINARILTKQMSLAKKLTLGFVGVSTAAIVGSAGIAAAQSPPMIPAGGSGYGGSTTNISTNINVNTKGNHNIIKIILSIF
jgi:hypothetical protein